MDSLQRLISDTEHFCRIAITGLRHVGKTTRLVQIYEELTEAHITSAGFVERAVFENAQRLGYDFESLRTHERISVARQNPATGKYDFSPEAWIWAERQLTASESHDVLIVDELGLLEARTEGLMPFLLNTLHRRNRHMIAAVRIECLDAVAQHTGPWDLILPIA